MDSKLTTHHLTQMVDFPTWSRTINGVIKESTIDHIYISNPYQITNIDHNSIIYTDHELITFKINQEKNSPSVTWKRDWRKYSKGFHYEFSHIINKHNCFKGTFSE